MQRKRVFAFVYQIVVHFFAIIGLVFSAVFVGMQFNLFSVKGSISDRNTFFQNAASSTQAKPIDDYRCVDGTTICDLFLTPEWQTVSYGLEKDSTLINKVATETGVSPRLLASLAVPEQLRFFSAERETYKKYFEPLKVLGTMSQFSLGVTGIKPKTADEIENNLTNASSSYYLGKDFEGMLSYKDGEDKSKVQFERLTNSKNHYYSYLYTALFIKEIENSWRAAGYPITEENYGVYATLFNLGFSKSFPKANPSIGGAIITVGGHHYTYGEVAERFLGSDKLQEEFKK